MSQPIAFPLQWPEGRVRHVDRERRKTRINITSAAVELKDTLRLFGLDSGDDVSGIVISSNATIGQTLPSDPGVAVYFQWRGATRCLACDRYARVEENLQTISEVVEEWRRQIEEGLFSEWALELEGA